MTALALVARFALRLRRSVHLRRSALAVAAAMYGLVALFVLQSAFTLTGGQVAERDLGRFDHSLPLTSATPARERPHEIATAAAAAVAAGATDVETELTSFDVSPALTGVGYTTYVERDWSPAPYPDRFRLVEGHWPDQPGEVAVSPRVAALLDVEDAGGVLATMPLLSGLAAVDVVGVVEDRFATSSSRVLAASGTFSSFDLAKISRHFGALDVRGSVWWDAGRPATVRKAIGAALPGSAAAGVTDRRAVESAQRSDFADSYPLGWKIPALTLPLLCALAVFAAGVHGLRRTMRTLRAAGAGRWVITLSVGFAVTGLLVVAGASGAALGAVTGLLLRPAVAPFAHAPLAPFPNLTHTLVLLFGICALALPVGFGWIHLSQREPHVRPSADAAASRGRVPPAVRRAAAVLAAVVALGSSGLPLDDVASAMVWIGLSAAGLLLLTPELVDVGLRVVPTRSPRGRLARRHLAHHRGRTIVSVLLVAVSWAAPLAFATVLATMIQTDEDDRVVRTAHGQVRIVSEGTEPPPPVVVRLVQRELASSAPRVDVAELETARDHVGVPDLGLGSVVAVATAADLERIDNRPLTAEQASTLARGGILYVGEGSASTLSLSFVNAGRPIADLPAAPIDLEPAWAGSHIGVVLVSTARELGLPVNLSDVAFTGLTAAQRARIESAVATSGVDPYFVKVFHTPEPVRAPPAFYVALVALCGIVVGVAMFVVRTQVGALRRVLGALVAVGVSPRWARGTVLLELTITTLIAGSLAAIVAGPITATALARLPGFRLDVPWTWLASIVGTCLLACTLGGSLSVARLRPGDRHQG